MMPGIVFHENWIRQQLGQQRQTHFAQSENQNDLDHAVFLVDDAGQRDAHAQQSTAIERKTIQKFLQRTRHALPIAHIIAERTGNLFICNHVRPQINCRQTDVLRRQFDADGKLYVSTHLHAARTPSAVRVDESCIFDQSRVHQLAQILRYGRQRERKVICNILLGFRGLCIVKISVNVISILSAQFGS